MFSAVVHRAASDETDTHDLPATHPATVTWQGLLMPAATDRPGFGSTVRADEEVVENPPELRPDRHPLELPVFCIDDLIPAKHLGPPIDPADQGLSLAVKAVSLAADLAGV